MEIVLSDNIWHVQENMQHFGFETIQQYIDYLDSCYCHVSNMNWDIFARNFCMIIMLKIDRENTGRNNSPYIAMFGKRLYLTNFMRNDYGRR